VSACPRDEASKWARAPRRLLDRRRVHPEPEATFDRLRFQVIKVYPHSFGAAQQHHLGEVTGPEPVFGALSGGGGVCLVDEGSGDVAEFAVAVWGNLGEQGECFIGGAAALAHDDAFGLLDDRRRGHRLFHLLGQAGGGGAWCTMVTETSAAPGMVARARCATRENTSANGTLPNTRVPSCRTAPSGSADDDEHDPHPDRRRHARIVRNRHRRVAVGRAGVGWAGLGWAGLGWAGLGLGWVRAVA